MAKSVLTSTLSSLVTLPLSEDRFVESQVAVSTGGLGLPCPLIHSLAASLASLDVRRHPVCPVSHG